MKCIFTHGLNCKRLFFTVVAVFIFILGSDFLIHQVGLKDAYGATASVWRQMDDMQAHMCWMFVGQFLAATFLSLIFARGYEGKGLQEGFRFGVLIGPFAISKCLIDYAVLPITSTILWGWVIGGLLQAMGASLVASLVYKK